jgi:hypothetical protein
MTNRKTIVLALASLATLATTAISPASASAFFGGHFAARKPVATGASHPTLANHPSFGAKSFGFGAHRTPVATGPAGHPVSIGASHPVTGGAGHPASLRRSFNLTLNIGGNRWAPRVETYRPHVTTWHRPYNFYSAPTVYQPPVVVAERPIYRPPVVIAERPVYQPPVRLAAGPGYRPAPVAAQVNGMNVGFVEVPNGQFSMVEKGRWIEQGNNGKQFQFTEDNRDDSSVYLTDNSRGVQLQLDLSQGKVLYSNGRSPMRPLYPIVNASAVRGG